jgi:hypothetical protein
MLLFQALFYGISSNVFDRAGYVIEGIQKYLP